MIDEGSLSNSPSIATAPESAPRDGWLPIANAPMDGTEFLAYDGRGIRVIRREPWHAGNNGGSYWFAPGATTENCGGQGFGDKGDWTHWQHLPDPPIANAIAEAPDSAEGVNP